MNVFRLIFRNLWFYHKPYLAVMAGIAISSAVLTGALIVGDSVRFSLGRITDMRLGKTRFALQPHGRLFTRELAGSISQRLTTPVAPVLISGGIAINSDKNLRINQVEVVGIDSTFTRLWDQQVPSPGSGEVIVSSNVAERLKLSPGDEMLLRIRNLGMAPSDAPFAAEKEPSFAVRVKISVIASDAQMGRFSLRNDQETPFNVFMPLDQMAALLHLKGMANLMLTPGDAHQGFNAKSYDSVVRSCWQPADAGIHFEYLEKTSNQAEIQVQVTTGRIFFDDATAAAITTAIPGCQPVMTYLANSMSARSLSTPYSFVAAAGGSFLKQPLSNDEIIINDWLAEDLKAKAGDSIMMRYFLMGPQHSLREDSCRFMVRSVIPVGSVISGRDLMPAFPGMTEAGNCRDWETGAPIDLKRIRDKDEKYWKEFKGTPKAFITIDAGHRIWGNRFGNYTAFRFMSTESGLPRIERSIMAGIRPDQFGLSFRPVYAEGQLAATNSTDFGELFLSLSFFILVSALLLSAMLLSLHTTMRMQEAGIMSAIGFRKKTITGIMAGEAFLVANIGSVAGALAGIAYNHLLILGLSTIWQDAVNTPLLVMKINFSTLATGASISVITAMITLLFVLWRNLRKPLSIQTKGSPGMQDPGNLKQNMMIPVVIAVVSLGAAMCLIVMELITEKNINSSFILIAGALILPGGWSIINLFLIRSVSKVARPIPGFRDLILKNLALHRHRSLAAIALLSLGTFTVIITGANRKTADSENTGRSSGTGGFILWAESVMPITHDLNNRQSNGFPGLSDEESLKNTSFIQLPGLDGDNASCLNLNQVAQPGILGVPVKTFDELGVFRFVSSDQALNKDHPWNTLAKQLAPGVIPAFADQTVITWGLRKSVGDTLIYHDESGNTLKIRLMGGLDNSIFQGKILVSDSLLRMYFPSVGGSRTILVRGDAARKNEIARQLEDLFRDYGLMATPANERLSSFNSVENTYLSVFMLLGGLGVLIGTVGLGIVLLRSIAERKNELALYIALGFRRHFALKLIISEHLFLLVTGMLLGIISAIPGIVPLIASNVKEIPWLFITGILVLIFANGFLWVYFPAKKILSGNIKPGLRTD